MGGVEIVETLNKLGGENGIGLADLVENRLVGMKSRGVYETPGGTILYHAHDVLETITLDKETARVKQYLSIKFADIVYNGQCYTPLREALTAFVNETQKTEQIDKAFCILLVVNIFCIESCNFFIIQSVRRSKQLYFLGRITEKIFQKKYCFHTDRPSPA